MPALPYPKSSTPGQLPGEGEGRLVNAFVTKEGDTTYVRRVPGLASVVDTGQTGPRGLVDVGGVAYGAYSGAVVKVDGQAVTVIPDELPGQDGITWAFNNHLGNDDGYDRDLVAVRESGGAFIVKNGTITPYPIIKMPATVNSVTFLGGFLLFTDPNGLIYASELNDTDIKPLSKATAESKPDGLVRGIVHGGSFYAMGTSSIEPWKNVGSENFPLQPIPTVMSVGLLTTMAVAGTEEGWDHNPFFVAHDRTVHEIVGYETRRVSTPDVERFIARSTVSTLEASVYTSLGNAFWTLSSDVGTWEYNVTTGAWHERVSGDGVRWRASRTVKSNGAWLTGDTLSSSLLRIDDAGRQENSAPLSATVESAALKEFPARIAIPGVFLNFTRADADVAISWSHDGGQAWSTPVTRPLETADRWPVRVNRVGLSTQHGLRVRWTITDPVDFSFMGGSVPAPQGRAP